MTIECRINGKGVVLIKALNIHSSSGMLKKWVVKDTDTNKIYYVKTASKLGNGKYGYECETECVIARLGRMLGINTVMYEMGKFEINDVIYKVCISESYSRDVAVHSIADIIPEAAKLNGREKYNYVTNLLKASIYANVNISDLNKILALDYITLNGDRHLNNIECFVINGQLRLVPGFDFGAGLLSNKSIYNIKLAWNSQLMYGNCKPFYNNFKQQKDLIDFCGLNTINQIDLYKLVNTYYTGERAKLINKLLKIKLSEVGLL